MKKLKIFPKTFLYSLAIMLLIVGVAHLILYLLLPQMVIDFVPSETTGNVSLTIAGSYEPAGLMKSAMLRALPLSVICCVFLSVLCAYFFSKGTTSSIRQLSKAVKKMSELDKSAQCRISSQDELGELANDVNQLYHRLLCMIENLELEKEKTSENERAKIDFLRSASHELKTPITSIKVLAESLTMQEDVPVELYREFMGDINQELDRMNKIVNDLLSLVKMDKSAVQMSIEEVNINEFIEGILKGITPIASKRNIEIIFESVRPVSAQIDSVKLGMAFTNIIENAVKYNFDNGWVKVTLNADHKFFYLRVADSGVGIPEELQDHIFERFYRVDKARSRETGGNGLGLAITRNAILLHRGSIKVHSVEKQGTTFAVRIPLIYQAQGGNS